MKVPIGGGQPERVTKDFAEFNTGFDVARDGKTVVLGTYDFKAQRGTLSLVSLDSGQVPRMFEYDPRHQGQPRFSPDGKESSTLSVKREWTIYGCNRWTAAPAGS